VAYIQFNNITGPTFTVPGGQTTLTGATITILPDVTFGKIYRVTRANLNNGHNTPQTYVDGFAQDTWRVGNRLTINPGLRFDQETLSGDLIKNWQLKNNFAPRIGATFDATGDGKTKIYGNYGIYYNRIPNDLAARALSADDGYSRIDYFDPGLTRLVPQNTATKTSASAAPTTNHVILLGSGADDVDPNTKMGYTNEVVLGFEREIMDRTTFGMRYVFRNMPRVVEDITDCPMAAYEIPQTAAVPCGAVYILTNPSSASPINAQAVSLFPAFGAVKFDDPIHRYNSIEFTLNRRGTNWTGNASYRYSRLRGNFEGFYRDDNGQSDPGISSLYDFPTNDPTYTTYFPGEGNIQYLGQVGVLPLDRPHQIKLFGNYMFPMGLNIGLNVNLSSGKPLTPMAANPVYDSAGEIPVAARGAGIQTVDGFMDRTPFESQVDLQAAWSLKIGGNRRISFTADVFNLFNETRTINYDQDTELTAGTPNPDFGKPVNSLLGGTPAQFQVPRALRVGARFEF
ncbi:MAG TPA: TonB-dependent receptor, partial [Vicinamibacterales bacterium]|nr:TonB-dependent receptor [Vicinamibacterales bacterium]